MPKKGAEERRPELTILTDGVNSRQVKSSQVSTADEPVK